VSSREWERSYESFADFYRDTYAPHVRGVHTLGRAGANLLSFEQSAGDWSDAPTPDLVISRLATAATGATMDVGGGRFRCTMPSRNFIVVPPGFATSILMDGAHVVEALAIPFRSLLDLAGGAEVSRLPQDGDFGPLHDQTLRDPVVGSLIDRLWQEARAGKPHGALAADGLVLEIAAALLNLRDGTSQTERGGLAPWQVRRVCEYLSEHLEDDTSLAELAKLVDLSSFHFCRAFKLSTGASPHAWLTRRRIERAQELISTDPSIGLTEIALSVGYGSQSAFGTAFRRVTGTTPSAWRRESLS